MFARLTLLLFAGIALAQPSPDTLWTYHLAEDGDWGGLLLQDIAVNQAGATFVCGFHVIGDVFIPRIMAVQLDARGRVIGGFLSHRDSTQSASGILPTADGGCLVSGTNYVNFEYNPNLILVKLDGGMNLEWSRNYDLGTESEARIAPAENGWFLVGQTLDESGFNAAPLVLRIDQNGDTLWSRVLAGDVTSESPVAVQSVNNELLVCTQASTDGIGYHAGLYKLNGAGTVIWHHNYDFHHDMVRDFAPADNGSGTILLENYDDNGNSTWMLMHVDVNGQMISRREIAIPSDPNENSYVYHNLVHSDAQTVAVAGVKTTSDFSQKALLAKVLLDGDTLWTREYSATDGISAGISGVGLARDPFGSYLIGANLGYFNWSVSLLLIKTGPDNVGWVEGSVRRAENQSPAAGITVRTDPDSAHAVTDAQGRYSLQLRSGVHSIVFEATGFCTQRFEEITIDNGQHLTQNVDLARVAANFDITSINAIWSGEELSIPFAIENVTNHCALTFACYDTSWWLSVSPSSGSIAPGQQIELRARVQGWLPNPPLEYQSFITIYHNGEGGAYTIPVSIFVTVDADEDPLLPTTTRLNAVYPNPFNPTATVSFDLAQSARVRVALYDVMGREVRTLADDMRAAGNYTLTIDGSLLAAGVYFVVFQAGDITNTQKIVLLK